MSRRFGAKSGGGFLRGILPPVCFFAAVLIFFFYALGSMTKSVDQEQLRSTEEAIRRMAVHCYAVEGKYPSGLEYLETHYGLQVDKTRYVVHYQPVAANLMPNISVFSLKELSKQENQAADETSSDPFAADGLDAPGLTPPPLPAPDEAGESEGAQDSESTFVIINDDEAI